MSYSETEKTCHICYEQLPNRNQEIFRCHECKIPVHKECAEIFGLEKASTVKKLKLEKSIYGQIRRYPQLGDSHLDGWFHTWMCDKCLDSNNTPVPCHFCKIKDGLLVKIKFQEKENKENSKENKEKKLKNKGYKEGLDYKWAHMNCILKVYFDRPTRDPVEKCYILETDELKDAPDCKTCGEPYKMDVKCSICQKFYGHNLCLNDDKISSRACNACNKSDDVQGKLDSNSSGLYIQRFIKGLAESGKYDEFCVNGDKLRQGQPKQVGRKRKEDLVAKETEKAAEPAVNEGNIKDHYMSLNEKNQLIYSFPNLTKEMFFQNELLGAVNTEKKADETQGNDSGEVIPSVSQEPAITNTNDDDQMGNIDGEIIPSIVNIPSVNDAPQQEIAEEQAPIDIEIPTLNAESAENLESTSVIQESPAEIVQDNNEVEGGEMIEEPKLEDLIDTRGIEELGAQLGIFEEEITEIKEEGGVIEVPQLFPQEEQEGGDQVKEEQQEENMNTEIKEEEENNEKEASQPDRMEVEPEPTPAPAQEEEAQEIQIEKPKKKQIFKIIREPRKKEEAKSIVMNNMLEKLQTKRKIGLDTLMNSGFEWHYISSIQILKQMQKIYLRSLVGRPDPDKFRLTKKWYELLEDLSDKTSTCLQVYDKKMMEEIKDKFSLYSKYRVSCEKWPMIPQSYRKYELIEEYVPAADTENFKKELQHTMASKKQHCCAFNCQCSDLKTLGPYLVEKQAWETECPGRQISMECDETCGCDLTKCKNRSITTDMRKRLNKDLKETYCWGIDYATHNHILLVLPDLPGVDKNDFIERKLLRAVHITETPYDMTAICKQIIQESKQPTDPYSKNIYTKSDRKLAKMLIRAIRFVNNFDTAAFRLHTKGYGVICMNPAGIPAHDMIAEYFGEIYTPWRWYEKQDLVKRHCKELKKKDELPDFYNIMLEKHKDDKAGYDILFIDPINKGNYSSRFSHSCDPNSGTVTTVAKGKYGVAMYSLRDISYGEELTFDYFSVTENEKEYEQAICLCGSQNCRIHYLGLVTSRNQNSYLEKYLPFIKLNYWLCVECLKDLTQEEEVLLDEYGFKGAIFEDCPQWLIKWIALILKFIREEKEEYVNFVLPKRKQELEVQIQRKPLDLESLQNLKKNLYLEKLGLETDRIQNLTITVNKVKYVLSLMKEKYERNDDFHRKMKSKPGKNKPAAQMMMTPQAQVNTSNVLATPKSTKKLEIPGSEGLIRSPSVDGAVVRAGFTPLVPIEQEGEGDLLKKFYGDQNITEVKKMEEEEVPPELPVLASEEPEIKKEESVMQIQMQMQIEKSVNNSNSGESEDEQEMVGKNLSEILDGKKVKSSNIFAITRPQRTQENQEEAEGGVSSVSKKGKKGRGPARKDAKMEEGEIYEKRERGPGAEQKKKYVDIMSIGAPLVKVDLEQVFEEIYFIIKLLIK